MGNNVGIENGDVANLTVIGALVPIFLRFYTYHNPWPCFTKIPFESLLISITNSEVCITNPYSLRVLNMTVISEKPLQHGGWGHFEI